MASTPADLQAVAQKLLSGDFDINLLDQIVGAAYDPISPHRAQANKALMQLQESPELWRMADTIIEQSQNPNSRFFGLQVLDDAIKIRYVKNSIGRLPIDCFAVISPVVKCWIRMELTSPLFMYFIESNTDGK